MYRIWIAFSSVRQNCFRRLLFQQSFQARLEICPDSLQWQTEAAGHEGEVVKLIFLPKNKNKSGK